MNKRRMLCMVISGALLMGCITGCGQNGSSSKLLDKGSPVVITIWHYYNGVQQTQFDNMVTEFNNTVGVEKGIIVEAVSKETVDGLADAVVAAARKEPGAEQLPDVFATYSETAYIVNELGCITDLRKYFTDEELDEYVDAYIEEGEIGGDGSLIIFPVAKSTEVMMINKTDWQIFSDATGHTYDELKTCEGIVAVADDYYNYTDELTPDVENDGKAFFGMDSVANYMEIGSRQLGAPFSSRNEDGEIEIDVNKKIVRKLWENYYVPFVKGYFAADSRYRSDDAKIGEIIALIGSTAGAVYFPTQVTINDSHTYPIENIVLPAPRFEGSEGYLVQQGAGMCVTRSSEKEEYASTVFLKWFTDTEQNIRFSAGSGYMPVKKEAADIDVIKAVCEESGLDIDDTVMSTLTVALENVKESKLYTSPAFDAAAELREFIGGTMQECAKTAYKEACMEIEAGGDREKVLEKYTDNNAFEKWYSGFESGLLEIAGEYH